MNTNSETTTIKETNAIDLLVGFDSETGGLDAAVHALLSVGVTAGKGMAWEQKCVPAPGMGVEEAAARVNGYFEEGWREAGAVYEGVLLVRLIEVLSRWRVQQRARRIVMVSHHAGFDQGFLYAALRRHDLVEAWEEVVWRRWRCSCATFGALMDAGLLPDGPAGLDDLGAARGAGRRDAGKAHDAAEDAWLAFEGYLWMIAQLRESTKHQAPSTREIPSSNAQGGALKDYYWLDGVRIEVRAGSGPFSKSDSYLPAGGLYCAACGSWHDRPVSEEHHRRLVCFWPWDEWAKGNPPLPSREAAEGVAQRFEGAVALLTSREDGGGKNGDRKVGACQKVMAEEEGRAA